MSTTKIVIICLLLVMAIFFLGLSLNLVEKPDQGLSEADNERQQEVASDYNKDSWVKAIDGLLAPFAASLKPEDVTIDCSHTKKGFYLDGQTSACKIAVPGFEEPFKKLSLKPDNPAVDLTIQYKPADGKDEKPVQWPSQASGVDNINFVILGGEDMAEKTVATIFIDCKNCSDQRRVKIAFE